MPTLTKIKLKLLGYHFGIKKKRKESKAIMKVFLEFLAQDV